MASQSIPLTGVLKRAPIDCNVVVGRFDEITKQENGTKQQMLLPVMSECTMPLRLKVPTQPAPDGTETLTLQDASGKQVFNATRSQLDSRYIVVMEDTAPDGSGTAVYRALPVTHWFTFTRAPMASRLSPEEQEELYELLQKHGDRPNHATYLRQKMMDDASGKRRFADEGGAADFARAQVGEDEDDGGTYRSGMEAAARKAKLSGKKRDRDEDGAGDVDYLETQYAVLDDGDGGDGEEGGARRGGGGGGDRYGRGYDEGGGGGLDIEVFGMEGEGEEQAADVFVDYFADDAGDDGGLEGIEATGNLAKGFGSDDVEMGAELMGAAVLGEDDLGVDLDSDAVDVEQLAAEAARTMASARDAEEEEAKAGSGTGTRPAKRARVEGVALDPVTVLREEVISFLKSKGGKATVEAVAKNFSRYRKDKTRLYAVLGELTKRETQLDGKTYFSLRT